MGENPDVCRFCLDENTSEQNPFISPCNCKGSIEHVHIKCLFKWMYDSGGSNSSRGTCGICKHAYVYTIPNFEEAATPFSPFLYAITATPCAGIATLFFGPLIELVSAAALVQLIQGSVLAYTALLTAHSCKNRALYIYYYFKHWSIHVLSLIATFTVINRCADDGMICVYYFLNCCIFYTHRHIDATIRARINRRILRHLIAPSI